MTGCGFEHDDGVYVLGALSPEDRVAFEKHLPGCATCANSVREIAGLPGLLSRVPAARLDHDQRPMPVPVPDTLLPSLLHHVRARRRRRTWLAAGLVAAVTVVGVSLGFALGRGDDGATGDLGARGDRTTSQPSAPPTAAAEEFATVGAAPISGWVSITPVPWGTRLDLTCTYDATGDATGNAYGHQSAVGYTMVITRRDGSTEEVASWTAGSGRTVKLSAATSSLKADIARVVVRTSDGTPVLRMVTG